MLWVFRPPLAYVEARVPDSQLREGFQGPVGVAGRGKAEKQELPHGGLLDEGLPVRVE